jgi:hypothetical protein
MVRIKLTTLKFLTKNTDYYEKYISKIDSFILTGNWPFKQLC